MNIKKLNEELDKLLINEISDRVEYNTKQAPYIEKDAANMKVKDWYISTYPTDDLGEKINPDVTFNDIYTNLPKVYDLLNVGDSIIRERVFEKIAEIKHVDYDVIYYGWLYNSKINESVNEYLAKYTVIMIDPENNEILQSDSFDDYISAYHEFKRLSIAFAWKIQIIDLKTNKVIKETDNEGHIIDESINEEYEKEVTNTNLGPQSGDFTVTFGPGNYYIGDICYCLNDDEYNNIWGKQYDYKNGAYGFFAVGETAYGDGEYYGGRWVFPVDAGVIGVVDMNHSKESADTLVNGNYGCILNISNYLTFEYDKSGIFNFEYDGHSFTIDTQEEEDEEDEWEEDEW